MAKVIGIDLGTIKSSVAIIEAGQPIQQTMRSIVPPQAKTDRYLDHAQATA